MSDWINVADITPRIAYTATAAQTAFVVPFVFFENSDLKVYQNATLLTLDTDYTVTGAEDEDGGTVTLLTGATVGDEILITRHVPVEQTTHIPPSGPLDVPAINVQISKLVTMIQQQADQTERAVHLPDNDSTVSAELASAATRSNRLLGFDTNGDLIYPLGPTFVDTTASGVAVVDTRATASVTIFDASINAIVTLGLAAVADGGGATYVRGTVSSTGAFLDGGGVQYWGSVSTGSNGVANFESRAIAVASEIASDVNSLNTLGYTTAGDGGGALYNRVFSEPSHQGKFQSADGAWWELAEQEVSVFMFGAKGDGSTDDQPAFQHTVDYICRSGAVPVAGVSCGRGFAPGGRIYKFGSILNLSTPLSFHVEGAIYFPGVTGTAVRIGTDAGWALGYDLFFETIYGDGGAQPVAVVGGGTRGVLMTNIVFSKVVLGSVYGFSLVGVDLDGFGDFGYQQTVQHNRFEFRQIVNNGYGLRMLSLNPATSSVQANRFEIQNIYQNYTNILIDDGTHSSTNSNTFVINAMDDEQSIGIDCYGSLNDFWIGFTGAPGTSLVMRSNSYGNTFRFGNTSETAVVIQYGGLNNRVITAPPSQSQLPVGGVAVANNTSYQNTYGVPIMVYVPLAVSPTSSIRLDVGPDVSALQTVASYGAAAADVSFTATFRVPAGGYWRLFKLAGTVTIGTAAFQDAS